MFGSFGELPSGKVHRKRRLDGHCRISTDLITYATLPLHVPDRDDLGNSKVYGILRTVCSLR